MNKKLYTFIFAATLASSAVAQISFGDIPATLKTGRTIDVEPEVLYPQIIASQQIAIDEERSAVEHMPMRIGKQVTVNYEFGKDGEWHTLPNGTRVWLLRIQSEGALALIPSYSEFYIPKGLQLFIYNASRTQILGSYTYDTHPKGGVFSTEPVAGDDITFELVVPLGKEELCRQVRLCLSGIGYVYNGTGTYDSTTPRLEIGESGSCMININNTEGADWQEEKKGVSQMNMLLDDGWYVCSGTMINTTAQDLRPYLLSACHCYSYRATPEMMLQWQFRFHYESPGAETTMPTGTKTLVGCRLLAASPIAHGSDGLLLELTEEIPLDWDVYFNGWDRRDTIMAGGGVSIHHPKGDVMKISTFKDYHTSTWPGEGGPGMDSAHWEFSFVKTKNGHSVTEGGSSGSPLFNKNHLVFGTLTGGSSTCAKPDGDNYYGKLAYHWDVYGDSCDTQMRDWLDPLHLGVETLQGTYYNPDAPRIELGTKEMLELDGNVGEPGEALSFEVTGFNLSELITAYAPEQFQVSADGVLWADSAMLDAKGGTLYVRYCPNITGNHYGNIEITSPEVRLKRYLRVHASCCREVQVNRELPNGEIQKEYRAQLEITGEDGPYSVELIRGNLPSGVSIDSTGLLTGVPVEDGIFDAVVNITDRFGCVTTRTTTLYVKSMVVTEYPFSDSFELENFGGFWKQTFQKGEVRWIQGRGINEDYDVVMVPNSGLTNAIFVDKSYDSNSTLLVSPQFDLSGAGRATLHFSYLLPLWGEDIDQLKVLYRVSAHDDWQLLREFGSDAPEWTVQDIDLPTPTAEYFVAFEGTGRYGYGIALDDISVTINDEESIERLFADDLLRPFSVRRVTGEHVGIFTSASALNELPKGVYLVIVDTTKGVRAVKYVK